MTQNNGLLQLVKVAEAVLPTEFGDFIIQGWEGRYPGHVEETVSLLMGDPIEGGPPLVRVHSECLTGDVFHSLRCDCRSQLEMSLAMIGEAGRGVIIYLRQEGRGIGLLNKLRAYQLQDLGADTVEANEQLGFKADHRLYEVPGAILRELGIAEVRLLSNNPDKIRALELAGIRVVERVPCVSLSRSPRATDYLRTKQRKLGHLLDL
jgi:GTP cyclohydrolase II